MNPPNKLLSQPFHFALVYLIVAFHGTSSGQSIEECESMKNASRRSTCFEKVAKRSAVATSKEAEFQRFATAAKKELTKDFFDPDSVNYRGVYITDSDSSQTLCGEVNGKNKAGGYIGYKPFIVYYDKKQNAFSSSKINNYDAGSREGELRAQLFDMAWQVSCQAFSKLWQE